VTSGDVKDDNAAVVDSYTGAEAAPPSAGAKEERKSKPAKPTPKAKDGESGDVNLF